MAFQDPSYQKILSALHIDHEELASVLAFCDLDGDGSIDYQEFCDGIKQMKDPTQKVDTWEIMYKLGRLERQMSQVQADMATMGQKLDRLLAK